MNKYIKPWLVSSGSRIAFKIALPAHEDLGTVEPEVLKCKTQAGHITSLGVSRYTIVRLFLR